MSQWLNSVVNEGGEHCRNCSIPEKDIAVKRFRVWDTRGKIMIYPSPHMNPLYLTLDGKLVEIDREGDEVPAQHYITLQIVGLTDMYGKDIYEGDMIKHHKYGGEHVVKWIQESAGFFLGDQSWPLSSLCSPNIEVIGNIYEDHPCQTITK